MVKYWNTGDEKRNKNHSKENVVPTFYDEADRHPISALAPENTPLLQKNQSNYIRFDSLNATLQYPKTQYSNIPTFQLGLNS